MLISTPPDQSETELFTHSYFDVYRWEEVPLNRDCYLMEDSYLEEYEKYSLDLFESSHDRDPVGYVSYVAVRKIDESSLQLSWYANVSTRFHELTIRLPRDAFIACVGCGRYDDKPHIFVKSDWLLALHEKAFSAFALVDAIGVKNALRNHSLSRDTLFQLRDRIDRLAARFDSVAFVSFADSLLLKSNWSVGHFRSSVKYTYDPDVLLLVIRQLRRIYREVTGLKIYAILTQGANEYAADSLLHISASGHHVSLNSLGIPFAELTAIDHAVSLNIKAGLHAPAELYIDEKFLHSLRFDFSFDRDALPRSLYRARMMSTDGRYYLTSIERSLRNLRGIDQ